MTSPTSSQGSQWPVSVSSANSPTPSSNASTEPSSASWRPLTQAAIAAGIPRRTVFRWAKLGVIEVRQIYGIQHANVDELRLRNGSAMTGTFESAAGTAAPATHVDRMAELESRISDLETFIAAEMEALSNRIAALEHLCGLDAEEAVEEEQP